MSSNTMPFILYAKDTLYAVWKDTIAPTMGSLTANTTAWTNGNVILTGKATDVGSGISYYQFSTSGSLTASSGGWTTITNTKSEISKTYTVSSNGTYYFYVKDKAGNINKKSIAVTNIDKTAPAIKYIAYDQQPVQNGLVVSLNGNNNTGNGHSSSTSTWTDLSGNSFDGYISGAKWNGNALDFDGVDDYVTFDNLLNMSQFTFEYTVSLDKISDGHIMSNVEWGGAGLVINKNGFHLQISNGDANNIYQNVEYKATPSLNKIYTLTGTFDGKTMKLYLDGVLRATATFSGQVNRTNGNTSMALGKNPYARGDGVTDVGSFLDGKLYSARIYDRAITASEVEQNYYADQYLTGQKTKASGQAQDTLSGIVAYQYSTSASLTASSSGWKSVTRTTALYTNSSVVSGTGNFYFYVKDAAGNIAKFEQRNLPLNTIYYNENYTDSNRSPGTASQNYGNRLTGLGNKSTTTSTRMKYSISNGVVTVTATADDGYGYTTGRVFLEKGHTYRFTCTTNGTWKNANSGDSVEAFLMLNGSTSEAYYRMDSNNFTFTPTVSGNYWLRLDVNQNGKTHTFSNIRIIETTLAASQTRYYKQEYGVMPTPFRIGYNFDGWYTAASGGTKVTSADEVTSSRTLYAHWSPISASITSFSAYISGTGWQNNSGNTVGTTGQSKSINGLKITLSPSSDWVTGEITYSVHQQNIGSRYWAYNPSQVGTTSIRGEGVIINLGGKLAKHYDIYYKAHSQNYGWLGWTKNGGFAGTSGYSYRVEAIKIQLVRKDATPPTEDSSLPASYQK